MLIKSIKHEFRATYRIILPILLALLLFAVITHFAFNILSDGQMPLLIEIIAGITFIFYYIGIAGAGIGVMIVVAIRFCRSLLSDQGYLNMTLPVNTHVHISSKLIVSVCWYLLTIIIIYISEFVVMFDSDLWTFAYGDLSLAMQELSYSDAAFGQGVLYLIEMLAGGVLGAAASTLMLYAAVSIGHSFQRHKMAWSILFIFVFSHIVGLIGLTAIFLIMINWMKELFVLGTIADFFAVVNMLIGIMLVIDLVASVVFYFITHYFLSKKLNLQ